MRAELPRLQAFVRQERGLDFVRPVRVEVLPDDEFVAELRRDGGEYDESGVGGPATLAALGLLPDGAAFEQATEDADGDGTLGFYDFVTDRLVLRGDEWNPLLESVLVHELVHALQDQHFPEAMEAAPDGEAGFALDSVIEGDANDVEDRYYYDQPEDWQEWLDQLWEAEPAAGGTSPEHPSLRLGGEDAADRAALLVESLLAAP